MGSRVSTKNGDKGTTRTLGGEQLSKAHPTLECGGALDCLRTETAMHRIDVLASDREDAAEIAEVLDWLLHVYFLIGTECNDPTKLHPEYRKAEVGPKHLKRLEETQASYEAKQTLPKAFIVAASTDLGAKFDHVCTTCRTLERRMVALGEAVPEFESEHLLAFVNRLSDFFYVLARHVEDGNHRAVDYSVLDD